LAYKNGKTCATVTSADCIDADSCPEQKTNCPVAYGCTWQSNTLPKCEDTIGANNCNSLGAFGCSWSGSACTGTWSYIEYEKFQDDETNCYAKNTENECPLPYGCTWDNGECSGVWNAPNFVYDQCVGTYVSPILGQQRENVQLFCECKGICSGSITISFRGQTTGMIPFNAPYGFVKGRLEDLTTVGLIAVSFDNSNTAICSAAGVTTTITFKTNMGDLPPVTVHNHLTSDTATPVLQMKTKQTITCQCVSCSGHFFLNLNGLWTSVLSFDSSPTQLQSALLILENVNAVSVDSGASSTLCADTAVTTTIIFTEAYGNVPKLKAISYLSGSAVSLAITSNDGQTENRLCSGRGWCDTAIGSCLCLTGYESSNGGGAPGKILDCGHQTTTAFACPTTPAGVCSGKGVCLPDKTCTCFDGYSGAFCQERSCPSGKSWFMEPDSNNVVHRVQAECSDKGTCNRFSGVCLCQAGFSGAACDRIMCPRDCSNNGKCLPMSALATYATLNGEKIGITYGLNALNHETWDHDQIYGCHCDKGYTGIDCSLKTCPFGDDPRTTGQKFETQTITCTADGGTFRLRFREAVTIEISAIATLGEFQSALQMLPTIGQVTISSISATICGATGASATVTFVTETGDLPTFALHKNNLALGLDSGSVTIFETEKGTLENVECSNRGLCDRSTGLCNCFPGFGQRDGYCGYPALHDRF
jgi:hypothetical protein